MKSIFIGVLLFFYLQFSISAENYDLRSESKSFIFADLGGVEVKIPNYFAKLVEYESIIGMDRISNMGRLKKIKSFGFDIRYPDMQGLSSHENYVDFKNRKVFTSKWMWVGVNSGSSYSGEGSISRLTKNSLNRMLDERSSSIFYYEKLPEKKYGMDAYTPKGTDLKTMKPNREHENSEDVFVANGDDAAYIVCSNRKIESAPCRHYFSLEPKIHAEVSIRYRRGLLPDWREIQRGIQKIINDFESK